MSKYLVDTTLLVEHLRGNEEAKAFLKYASPYISTVSIAELIQGSKDKADLYSALKLCKNLSEAGIDKRISSKAIELMKKFYLSKGLRFLDALIGATALENKLSFITGNMKHFKFIKGLTTIAQEDILKDKKSISGDI